MSDKTWTMKAREWCDPDATNDGFASARFESDSNSYLSGRVVLFVGGNLMPLLFNLFGAPNETDLRRARNKIAVIRQMLGVAEEALNRYEGEG